MKVQAIVPAAGQGKRLQNKAAVKSLVLLNGKPLFVHALLVLEKSVFIDSVVLVVPKATTKDFAAFIKKYRLKKVKHVITGGERRTDSVYNGLRRIDKDTDYILIHDAARPLVTQALIKDAVKSALQYKAVATAVPVKSTIKRVDPKSLFVQETLIRDTLWEAQTPQVFARDLLIRAHEAKLCCDPTDDAMLVEKSGARVKIIQGEHRNIKITTADDIILAENFFKKS